MTCGECNGEGGAWMMRDGEFFWYPCHKCSGKGWTDAVPQAVAE